MDHLVYIAAAGLKETAIAQAVNANNLANASTVGFKGDLAEAQSVYLVGEGEASRAYNMVRDVGIDLREGMLEQTGRDLDIAINGPGWFAVQSPTGGEALSRRGDLRIDDLGQLVNGAGEALMGNDGPIALPPFSSLSIGADGTISIIPLGERPNAVAVLDRIKLVNPPQAALSKNDYGQIQAGSGLPMEPDGALRIVTGALESSNVNPVGSMIEMIELSRQFESFIRAIKVGEELDTASASLMRLQ
jgi:flagellar basal-body rod protein FlgF